MAVVFDTNVLISAAFFAGSKPAAALQWAIANDRILASTITLSELVSTLDRPKFDRYASKVARRKFIVIYCTAAHLVSIRRSHRACRDPKDDKFLDVAVNGGADILVTGDADLLTLDPFEGIPIVSPTAYLARVAV